MRRFPLEVPVAQVIETAAPWLISRSDVHTTRRLMRLEAIDGVSRSRFGERSEKSALPSVSLVSLTPFEKALVSSEPGMRNHSRLSVTPTGIEPVLPT